MSSQHYDFAIVSFQATTSNNYDNQILTFIIDMEERSDLPEKRFLLTPDHGGTTYQFQSFHLSVIKFGRIMKIIN